jgi:hypothetical protein
MNDNEFQALKERLKKSRAPIVEKLLALSKKIEADVASIEECKEQLREFALELGEGFTDKLTLGAVKVGAGSKSRLTGYTYELDLGQLMSLPSARLKRLIADKVINQAQTRSKESKPAVSIDLA